MKHLLRSGLFISFLFLSSFLHAQSDCTSYPEVTLIGDTVCFSSGNASVTVKNTVLGKTYQAYWGDKAVGAPVVSASDGGQLTLTLPINDEFTVGSHIISLRSSAVVCPANTFPGDTAMVVINNSSIDHLKVKGDTICDNSPSATITIQNTKPGEIFQIFQGSVAFGQVLKSEGGDLVVSVAREKLARGSNPFYVKVTIQGCGSVYLNDFATIVVNVIPSPNFTASATSPICDNGSTIVTIPNSSIGVVYRVYKGDTQLGSDLLGTGGNISASIPASALVMGQNTLVIKATVSGPKGCMTVNIQLSLMVTVNTSPAIPFQLEKDTVVENESDSFAEIVILSSAQGVVFVGTENTSLIGTVQTSNTGRDTLKLPIGLLSVGTHAIVVRALVNGCTSREFKDTVIVIIKPVISNELKNNEIHLQTRVWPNPFASELHVQAKQLRSGILRISDALGSTLYEQEIHSEEITIPSLWPSGVYYLEISGEGYKEQVKLVK